MKRALIYTDLQAGEGSERCFKDPTIPLQRYRVSEFYAFIHDLWHEMKCDSLWDGGDLLDDRTAVPVPTLYTVFDGLSKFRGSLPNNLKLIGNHEMFFKSGPINSGPAFDGVFNVYAEPKVIQIEGVRVLLCPYPGEGFDLESWIVRNLLPDGSPQLVFGHFQVEGTKDRDGRTIDGGVHVSALKNATLTLLGHIHHPQSVTSTVHYIGSPFQQDFGEANEEKRVAILDLPSLDLMWCGTDGFPTYSVVTLNEWESLIEGEGDDSENRYRVVLNSKEDHGRYLGHPRMNRAQPVYQGLESSPEIKSKRSGAAHDSFNPQDIIERYFRSRKPSNLQGLSEADFVQTGLELLRSP